ncbi:ribonuclease D [Shewanella psychropiezotolerans]|uniref:Ribonuclease D n=1 Tax=Shewanella psychropiezotolerans TaxID=2593655 RepID=A0ABX5X1V7_9GAMM|nr:ribonuclease D [Shewanella psychropiezotolerans]QDO84442.1 ribonuclease D [Shewanella psychropiezotolerans]
MLAFEYIEDDASLTALVSQYRQSDLLVLDTEFVRTRTFYARLGLIQAYDGKTLALIDPVAVNNLSEFWSLLTEPGITTVLHSCSEDLEVFARNGDCQPANLFDSQIAAALCGLGHGLGYAKLVEQTLDISLDKGESRTDWMKRPLSEAQLNYAANDVYYLYNLYPQLLEKLQEQGRLAWVIEEGERMTRGRLTPPDLEQAYLKVKNAFQLSPRQLAYLKVLARWRLKKAITRDLAVGFVVKDHALIGLAKKQPKNSQDLFKMIELTEQEKRIHGKDLLALLNTADVENPPKAIDVIALKTGYKTSFKAIKNCLVSISEEQQVPIELLGSKRYIHGYLQWLWDGKTGESPLLLTGWRKDLVETALTELKLSNI